MQLQTLLPNIQSFIKSRKLQHEPSLCHHTTTPHLLLALLIYLPQHFAVSIILLQLQTPIAKHSICYQIVQNCTTSLLVDTIQLHLLLALLIYVSITTFCPYPSHRIIVADSYSQIFNLSSNLEDCTMGLLFVPIQLHLLHALLIYLPQHFAQSISSQCSCRLLLPKIQSIIKFRRLYDKPPLCPR